MTDEELIKSLANMYFEERTMLNIHEYYLGIYKNTKNLIPIDTNNLDYYNNLLKPYNLKMELDPEEEDYVLIFDSSYHFNPDDRKI